MFTQQELSQYDIRARAQLLKELFKRIVLLLNIHSTGPLLILWEDVDEVYIRLRRSIETLLQTDGFIELRENYPEVIPSSLHYLGDDADVDWDSYISHALNKFKGEILEFCIGVHAISDDSKGFAPLLASYDKSIESFRRQKREEEQKWHQKVDHQAEKFKQQLSTINPGEKYVEVSRIEELRKIKSDKFDLAKLIEMCEELNKSYSNGSYLAVAMLMRALLDHVPPVFGCKSFGEVANNYGGTKSFKQSMTNLENSLRKIADAHLHEQMRHKEILPTKAQVNFSPDLDVLLAEIVRSLKG